MDNMMKNLFELMNGENGYSTDLKLMDSELDILRKCIRMQWLYRLQLLTPKQLKKFDDIGMEHYHDVSNLIDHAGSWPKTSRVLPREDVAMIREMDFFKELESSLGSFHISDEEHLGWENIYWRIVRPGDQDVGSLHADKWFWDIGGYGEVANFEHERLKIWIAIYAVPGKNGFMLLPGSHLKTDWKWHSEKRYGLNKPVFDENIDEFDLKLLPLDSGETVIFHDALIHGGAVNLADTTRISLEFTLLIPKYEKSKMVTSDCALQV
jgi:hypothetical protein